MQDEFAGRKVVDRNAMVAYGIGRSTIDAQYKQRAETGFPEKATRHDRVDYWFLDEWESWFTAYRGRKSAALSPVDRTGDPEDLLYADQVAEVIGWKDGRSVTALVAQGYFPAADDYDGARPQWKRATVLHAADARTGHGNPRTRTRKSREPKREKAPAYKDDPRVSALRERMADGERPQAVDIAAEHNVSTRTAERWLRAAADR